MSVQGHDVTGYYLHEDSGFDSAPTDSTAKAFGANATVDDATGANNSAQIFEPGDRTPADIVSRMFEGSFSVSFGYTNPWWLNCVYGAPDTVDNADGSYTHTWDGQSPQSQRIATGRQPSGKVRWLTGCVVQRVQVRVPVGQEQAEVTLSGLYANEDFTSPASLEAQPALANSPLNYEDASLSFGGSNIGYVQEGTVEVQNNIELIRAWEARTAIDFSPRSLLPTFNATKISEENDSSELEKMYGSAGATSPQSDVDSAEAATVTLDNGKAAGSGINKLTSSMTGAFPESFNEQGLGDPDSDVMEQLNKNAESVKFTATNEVAAAK